MDGFREYKPLSFVLPSTIKQYGNTKNCCLLKQRFAKYVIQQWNESWSGKTTSKIPMWYQDVPGLSLCSKRRLKLQNLEELLLLPPAPLWPAIQIPMIMWELLRLRFTVIELKKNIEKPRAKIKTAASMLNQDVVPALLHGSLAQIASGLKVSSFVKLSACETNCFQANSFLPAARWDIWRWTRNIGGKISVSEAQISFQKCILFPCIETQEVSCFNALSLSVCWCETDKSWPFCGLPRHLCV